MTGKPGWLLAGTCAARGGIGQARVAEHGSFRSNLRVDAGPHGGSSEPAIEVRLRSQIPISANLPAPPGWRLGEASSGRVLLRGLAQGGAPNYTGAHSVADDPRP